MRSKILVSSLALTALGALTSGAFLNSNKLDGIFTGVSSLFSKKDKVVKKVVEEKPETRIGISEEKQLKEEAVAQPAIKKEAEQPVAIPVKETVKLEEVKLTPVSSEQKRSEAPKPQARTRRTRSVPKSTETYNGGGRSESSKFGKGSKGGAGWCVTTVEAKFVPDVSVCWKNFF